MVATLLFAMAARVAMGQELVPVPDAVVEGMEASAQQTLAQARQRVDDLLDQGELKPAELAASFGRMGQLYLTAAQNLPAEACFRNAATLAPEDYRWPYLLGVLFSQERRLGDAEFWLSRTLATRPEYIPTLLRLGEVLRLQGRLEEAAVIFRQAEQTPDAQAFVYYGLGKIAAQQEDWEMAIQYFANALDLQPEASAIHHPLGIAYRESGDNDKARQHLQHTGRREVAFADPLVDSLSVLDAGAYFRAALRARERNDLETAIEHYRQAVKNNPENAPYHRALAGVLLSTGAHTEAIREYERALELEPDSAIGHLRLAQALSLDEDQLASSLEHYRRATELAPDDSEVHLALARALASHGRHAEAEPYFARAVEFDPQDHRARTQWGRSLAQTGNIGKAAQQFQSVLQSDSGNARAWLDLGTVLLRLGRPDDALDAFHRALELDLDKVARNLALLSAGSLHQQLGDDASAIPLLRQVTKSAPHLKDAHFNLGAALARTGQLDEAAESFAAVVKMDPTDVQAQSALAGALTMSHRYTEARVALEAAVPRLPDNLFLRHSLASLLATCPQQEIRDGKRAVELATGVFRDQPSLLHGTTLAAAMAEAGQFEEAIDMQRRLVAEAERRGQPRAEVDKLRRDLRRYERRQPPLSGEPGTP